MNDTIQPTEAAVTQPVQPETPQVVGANAISPTQPVPVSKHPTQFPKNILTAVMAVVILALVGIVLFLMRSKTTVTSLPVAGVTPTVIVTPTPAKPLSKIAVTEAFAAFSSENASFSATLDAFALQDSTLVPPTFDIELTINQ